MSSQIWEMFALTSVLLIALIFVQAVVHKINDFGRFVGFVADYKLVPEVLEISVARLLILLEILTILLLVSYRFTAWGAALAIGLLLLYAAGISINLLRGRRHIECGCGGSAQPISWGLVLRNLLLSLLAGSAWIVTIGSLSVGKVLIVLVMGTVLWLFYLLLAQLLANGSHLSPVRGMSAGLQDVSEKK